MSSFITEVTSLKPGNVSRFSEGHGMTVDDFIKSAELTSPILCDPTLSVGERVLEGVRVTMSGVGCNTNLGMLMLFAPLVRAAELGMASLQSNLGVVLRGLDVKDTICIFEAIHHANPGGLGESEKYDVNKKLDAGTTIQKAMAEAKNRDLIAKQYVTGFIDILSLGFICIEDFAVRWNSVEWAAVACYIGFMAEFPDSHIRRKFGLEVAEKIKIKAVPIAKAFQEQDSPEDATEMLMKFDRELKIKGVNPGTS
ncbi:MAG: triphosphoribosyl-dephospho-CoA synthase, partial [Gammaproteobacteria bacterium]